MGAILDRETEIRVPHAKNDPRPSVTMVENWAKITLFFPEESGLSGEAAPVEVRLTAPPVGQFRPQRFAPRLPLYLRYARASMQWPDASVADALRDLRQLGTTSRGLSDDFYRRIAASFEELEAQGEPYLVKAIAEANNANISTASRWISTARQRGYLPPKEDR